MDENQGEVATLALAGTERVPERWTHLGGEMCAAMVEGLSEFTRSGATA